MNKIEMKKWIQYNYDANKIRWDLKWKKNQFSNFRGKLAHTIPIIDVNIELANLQISNDNNRRIKQHTN